MTGGLVQPCSFAIAESAVVFRLAARDPLALRATSRAKAVTTKTFREAAIACLTDNAVKWKNPKHIAHVSARTGAYTLQLHSQCNARQRPSMPLNSIDRPHQLRVADQSELPLR